ncbi:hypothetical protein MYX04_11205 [Nitrospiraceae bacterium AH_259_D15_M11_P09]|nr:hypothetical protein [Nitrospiraceae bacterium AH_259_D15_M11_P09]
MPDDVRWKALGLWRDGVARQLEAFWALCHLLKKKGLITDNEVAEARKDFKIDEALRLLSDPEASAAIEMIHEGLRRLKEERGET